MLRMAGEGREDYYVLLGIGRDADARKLRTAWRRLARLTPRSRSLGVAPLPDREACGIED